MKSNFCGTTVLYKSSFNLFVLISDEPCVCGKANDPSSEEGKVNAKMGSVNRIINGNEAKAHEYPWQVALVKAGGHSPICGGSIISDRHVITAAHCTEDVNFVADIEVRKTTGWKSEFAAWDFWVFLQLGSRYQSENWHG